MTCSVGSCWWFRNEAEWSLLASGYDDVVRNNQNVNPGYYLEKVPWLRLVTCLLNFSRFQRCESYSLSPLSSPTSRCGSAKLTAKALTHAFDTGVQYGQCSTKRFALHCIWLPQVLAPHNSAPREGLGVGGRESRDGGAFYSNDILDFFIVR